MSDSLDAKQLDTLGKEMGKVRFSPTGSNFDEFTFAVKQSDHSLIFRHGNIRVTVSNFKLVDFDHWPDRVYPAIENRIVQYLFQADVQYSAHSVKGKGHVVLGYWRDKEKLLAPLGRGRERDIIDTLLLKIDRVAMGIFPLEAVSGAHPKYPEDMRGGPAEF